MYRCFPRRFQWRRFVLALVICLFALPQFLFPMRQAVPQGDTEIETDLHNIPEKIMPRRLLPTPILVLGLPKTGTSSVHAFFERSGYASSHFKCINGHFCGLCIKAAIKSSKPPLQSCGAYEVWAQMDIENLGQCHLPQVHDLDAFHAEAPNATFILTNRNMSHWAKSVRNWVGGGRSMAARLAKCEGGPKTRFPEDLIDWHLEHQKRIREFVQNHPSHVLVEIDIEDPQAGDKIARRFGSDPRYWGHENDSLQRNVSRTTSRAD